MDDPKTLAALISAILGVGAIIAGVWRLRRPVGRFWSRLNGTFDAVVGREAYVDQASGRMVEALPPLTTRVARVEEAVVEFSRVVEEFRSVTGLYTESQKRVGRLETRVDTLSDRVEQVEQVAKQAVAASRVEPER